MDHLTGLNNLSNTCYLNAALQILINCTVLTKVILSENFKSDKINCFKNFLIDYNTSSKSISPSNIKKLVGNKYNKFHNNEQHDSHEFLINFIEIIDDEFKKEYKENNIDILGIKLEDFMSNIFDTVVSSVIYSEETNEKSKTKIGEKILSLSIPNSIDPTLEDCFDFYTQIEQLSDNCQWRSKKENRLVDAYKRLNLKSLPKYLLIQLKRFTFFSNSNKNNNNVKIPINLKIKSFNYQLRGIIFHMGSANGGHYISIINKNNKWFICNDSEIKEVQNIDNYLNKGYTYLFVKNK